jgi:hypothetical protein
MSDTFSPAAEDVLLGPWFFPFSAGTPTVHTMALTLKDRPVVEIEAGVEELEKKGLVSTTLVRAEWGKSVKPLEGLYKARERLLRERGRRHPVLQEPSAHSLKDVILAFAMCRHIWNTRTAGRGFLADDATFALIEIETYLPDTPPAQIAEACTGLEADKLIKKATRTIDGAHVPAIEATLIGRRAYDKEVRQRLGLTEEESILDTRVLDSIDIFWAWQSDFTRSRNQISTAIDEVVSEANESWRPIAPFRRVDAVDVGDGAVHIDQAIQAKIKEAAFFVADITPTFKAHGRRVPNPNVLIEVGFALGTKAAERLVLVSARRDPAEIVGIGEVGPLPFDIEHIHRIEYDAPKDLRSRLKVELETRSKKLGLLRPAASTS